MTVFYISKDKDSTGPASDNANIIPFPARPATRKPAGTGTSGAHLISLSIRQALRRTRERILHHLRMTGKPAHRQGKGKYRASAAASIRKTA